MPKDFDRCVEGGGRVRRISGPSKKWGLDEGQHRNVCFDEGGAHLGEVKESTGKEASAAACAESLDVGGVPHAVCLEPGNHAPGSHLFVPFADRELPELRVPESAVKRDGDPDDPQEFPRAAYAYAPDYGDPEAWKLRLWDDPQGKETLAAVKRAVHDLGRGYRGRRVQVEGDVVPTVKRTVLRAWLRAPGSQEEARFEPAVLVRLVDDGTDEDVMAGFDSLCDALGVPDDQGLLVFKQFDDEQQVGKVEVYCPGVPDSQGEFMTREEIQKLAWRWMEDGLQHNVDRNHDNKVCGATIIESFVADEGNPPWIPGAWVVAVKFPDHLWQAVKSGEINGISMEALVTRQEAEIELFVPERLEVEVGSTSKDDHVHRAVLIFGDDGEVVDGWTLPDEHHDGTHRIRGHSTTEKVHGHHHRVHVLDALLAVQPEAGG